MERALASIESGANALRHGVQLMGNGRDARPELALIGK